MRLPDCLEETGLPLLRTFTRLSKLWAALALVLGIASSAEAGKLTLAWDPSPDPEVIGYFLVYGTTPTNFDHLVDIGIVTTTTIQGLANNTTYYFATIGYTVDGRFSEPSNIVAGVATNLPHELLNPGAQSSVEGQSILHPLTASNPDGDGLQYVATGLPEGLRIDPWTGVIDGVLSYESAGAHTVTIDASDSTLTSAVTFVWTVAPTNRPPSLASLSNRSNPVGATVGFQLPGGDPDGDNVTFEATGLPEGISLAAQTGFISGIPSGVGTNSVVITVSDATLSRTGTFSWSILAGNSPPVLDGVANRLSPLAATIEFQLLGHDADNNTLSYTADNLPPGITLDAATGTIGGATVSAGTFAVLVHASDGLAMADGSFTWTVADTHAPVLAPIADGHSSELTFAFVQLHADDEDNDPLTFQATGLPPGLELDASTGQITGIPTVQGSYLVTASVSDSIFTATDVFNWTVALNGAPFVEDPGEQNTAAGGDVLLELYAADPDGEPLAFSASGLPPGLSIDHASGVVSGNISSSGPGTYVVSLDVSDSHHITSVTFPWIVRIDPLHAVQKNAAASSPDTPTVVFAGYKLPQLAGDLNVVVVGWIAPATAVPVVSDTSGNSYVLAVGPTTNIGAGTQSIYYAANIAAAAAQANTVSVVFSEPVSGADVRIAEYGGVDLVEPVDAAAASIGYGQFSDSGPFYTTHGRDLIVGANFVESFTEAAGYGFTKRILTHSGDIVEDRVTDSAGEYSASAPLEWDGVWIMQAVAFKASGGGPVLGSIANQTSAEGESLGLALTVSDPDGDVVSFSATGLPPGLAIDPVSGTISGTLSYVSAGIHSVSVAVSDGGASDNRTFTWTIANVNRPPTLGPVASQSSAEGQVVSLGAVAADPDPDVLTFSATNLPPGLSISAANGVVAGTLTFDAAGTYDSVVTVSDGDLTASQAFTWSVANINLPPVLTAVPSQTHAENATVALALSGTDADNDTLTYSASTLPPGLTINATTGAVTGTLTFGASGTHTVTVTVSDGSLTDSQTFTWTVSNVNRPPTLTAVPSQTHEENATVSLALSATDPDGDALTYSAATLPSGLAINATTGAITGTLTFDASGTHTVSVTVSDGSLTDSQTFTWTVSNVNRPPVLTAIPSQTHAENATVSLALSATDPDGDALTYSPSTLPSGLAINATTGAVTGTLTFGASGTYTVTVTVSDGSLTDSQTFTWTVSNVNRPPVLTAVPSQTHAENATVSLALSATDPDGDALTYSASTLPSGLAINATTGAVTGTLTFGASGTHTVTVTVSDGSLTDSQTFTWTVSNVNRPPTLTGVQSQTHAENAFVSLALSATDPDGDALTYSASTLPPGLVIDATTGAVTGTLTFGASGTHTVTVTVSDGSLTDSQTFTWTVSNVNRPPVLTAVPSQTHVENATVSLALSATDPDGDALAYSASTLPSGLAINATTGAITGTLTFGASGTHTVTVTVTDGSLIDSQTFTWTVSNVNRPPVLTAVPSQTHAENATVSLALSATDPDGDALTYSAATLPSGLAINATTGAITGTLTFDASGTHTVTVTVSDGSLTDSQTFTWTVANLNRAPLLLPVADRTNAEGAHVAFGLIASDPDEDALTFSATGLPPDVTINPATGLIAGTLSSESAGTHGVTVSVTDGLLTATAAFAWTVTAINHAPSLPAPAAQSHLENTTLSLPLVATDPDGDTLTFEAAGLPEGLSIDAATGIISGTLSFASAGPHTVTVAVTDGLLSDSKTFTWTVANVNRPPVLAAIPSQTHAENAPVSLALAAVDPDGDTLSYTATDLPPGLGITATTGAITGTLPFTASGSYTVTVTVSDGSLTDSQFFTWTVTNVNRPPVLAAVSDQSHSENADVSLTLTATDPDGDTLTYTATGLPAGLALDSTTGVIAGAPTFASAGPHSVTITLSDGTLTDSGTFSWTVADVNRPPVLTVIPGQNHIENAPVSLALSAVDPDGDTLTYSAVDLPPGLGITATTGAITGTLPFTASGSYTVTVTVSDGALADSQTFTWTVANVNRPPVLTAVPSQTHAENAAVSLALSATDPDGDALAYSASALPSGLGINATTGAITGTLTFTASGTHTATVTVSDGTLADSQTFTWTVANVNRPPGLTAVPSQTDAENATVLLALSATDPDGDALTYSASTLPSGLAINATTGAITGTLTFGASGTHTVTVTVSDGLLTDSQTFTWTVANVNRPPGLTAVPSQTHAENATVLLALSATDPDGDALTYSASTLPSGLAINATTGAITGTLTFGASGTHTVTVTVSDGLLTDSQTFTWTVANVNRPPVLAVIPDQSHIENAPVSLALSAVDPDGDTLSYTATNLPSSLGIDATTGAITGTLPFTASGSYTVTVTVSDGALADSQTFTWTVANVNRPPVLAAIPSQTHAENAPVSLALSAVDPDGDTLTYSAVDLPPGLGITATTGAITGTLPFTASGSYTVTVTVSDGTLADSQTFTWTVANVNRPPVLTVIPDQSHIENAPVSLALSAADPDGDTLTYSAVDLPPGLGIHATTGTITGTLPFTASGSYTVTVTVSDGMLTDSQAFAWTVTNLNRPPVLAAVIDRTNAEGAHVEFDLAGSDPDGDSLTFSAVGLPPNVTIDPLTGAVNGILSSESAGTHAVVLSVTDGGLSVSESFTWTVTTINHAPTLTAPTTQTHPENSVVTLALVSTDPDGDTLVFDATGLPEGLSLNDATGVISGILSFASAGPHTVSITVTDGLLSDTQTFTWTVTNVNRAPVLSAIANRTDAENEGVSLQISATDADGDAVTYSATGLPAGLLVHPTTGTVTGTLGYQSAGPHTVTVTAADADLSHSQTFIWTVTNVNRPPVLVPVLDQSHLENADVSLALAATDPDDDTLAYTATGLPPGLAIDPATGIITGTLPFTASGTFTVTATVSDGTIADSETFAWMVTNVNRPPALSPVQSQTHAEGSEASLSLVASDPDGQTLTFAATGLPASLNIDTATGQIAGTLSFTDAGVFSVVVTVSDGDISRSQSFTLTVTDVNRPPVLSAIPAQSHAENSAVVLNLIGSDPDGSSLTFGATGLPGGLSIDTGTGAITGTLSFTSAGIFSVTATVSDGALSDSRTFAWTVSNVNRLPVVAPISSHTDIEGASVSLQVSATDPDDDPLTYSAAGLPSDLVINPSTGVVSGVLSSASVGSFAIVVTASDESLSGSQTFSWTVTASNHGPALTLTPAQTHDEGTTVSLALAATDPDGDSLVFSALGLPPGLAVNTATGLISGTLLYTSSGVYSVSVGVSDGVLSESHTFSWMVTNVNRSPVLAAIPGQSHAENSSVSVSVSAEDPDDGDALAFSATGLPSGLAIDPMTGAITGTLTFEASGIYATVVTVSDGALSHSQAFTWTVINVNRAPVLASIPSQTSDENTTVTLELAATDPDGDMLTFAASGLPAALSINPATGAIIGWLPFTASGSYSVTITVSDGSLASSQTFTWTVTNVNRSPILVPVTSRANSEGAQIVFSLVASDPDGDLLTFSATGLPPDLSINGSTGVISGVLSRESAGTHNVSVSVTDGELSVSYSFTWTVSAVNHAPTLLVPSAQSHLENTLVWLPLVATDPDGDTLSFEATGLPQGLSINPATGIIAGTLSFSSSGAHVVTLSVTDGLASDSHSFTWTVTDVIPVPALTLVTPGRVRPGRTNVSVFLVGFATQFVQGETTVSFGAGVSVNGVSVQSATQATASVSLAADANLGPRDVTVTTGSESVTLAGAFTITMAAQTTGDFDGDGKTDITLFRPSMGIWYVRNVNTGLYEFYQWGMDGDIPVPADYDGDGKVDSAVWRPSTGIWYIRNSSDGSLSFLQWGLTGDIPVPGDYDGDGKADATVFRPSTGIWYVRDLVTNAPFFYQWGLSGDIPVAADYDADGKTDVAVWRPSTGIWYIRNSRDASLAFLQWGLSGAGDIPAPGDYDGDGKADAAVFRPSTGTWYVRDLATNAALFYQWGLDGDVPVSGDFDGDGRMDVAVFRPSTSIWYVRSSSNGAGAFYQWGITGDVPVLKRTN